MTSRDVKGTRLTFDKHGHAYALHYPDGTTRRVRSVTAVSSSGRAQALERWNSRITAETTAANWDTLHALDPAERLERMRGYATIERNRAALRGTNVHAAGDRLVRGHAVELPADPTEAGMIEAYARWLGQPAQAWLLSPANLIEQRLLVPGTSTLPPIAGTSDIIATDTAGRRIILDLKTKPTGKLTPRAEWGPQLWAYGLGHTIADDGTVDEQPPTRAYAGSVIIITPEGVHQVWLRGKHWWQAGRVWTALRNYNANTLTEGSWSE